MSGNTETRTSEALSQLQVAMDVPKRRTTRARTTGKHLIAFGSMIGGTVLVLGLVVAMNSALEPPKAQLTKAATEFTVDKKPPPKKEKAPRELKARKVRSSSSAPRPPLPNLGSAVGGVDFDLPGIEGVDLGDMGKSLLGDANTTTAMTVDAVDDPPKPRRQVAPEYPDRARERGIEGYVKMRVKVASSGDVASVRVVEAMPKGTFDQVAVAAMQRTTFDPGLYAGRPTDAVITYTLNFRLN